MINLGIEGMMLTAAMTAVIAAQLTHSVVARIPRRHRRRARSSARSSASSPSASPPTRSSPAPRSILLALGVTGFVYRELQQTRSSISRSRASRIDVDRAARLDRRSDRAGVPALENARSACASAPAASIPPPSPRTAPRSRMHRWTALGDRERRWPASPAPTSRSRSPAASPKTWSPAAASSPSRSSSSAAGNSKAPSSAPPSSASPPPRNTRCRPADAASRSTCCSRVPYVVTLLILCGIAGRVRAPESLLRESEA